MPAAPCSASTLVVLARILVLEVRALRPRQLADIDRCFRRARLLAPCAAGLGGRRGGLWLMRRARGDDRGIASGRHAWRSGMRRFCSIAAQHLRRHGPAWSPSCGRRAAEAQGQWALCFAREIEHRTSAGRDRSTILQDRWQPLGPADHGELPAEERLRLVTAPPVNRRASACSGAN